MSLRHVAIVHLTALPAWLSLQREERRAVIEEHVAPALAAYPQITIRWIDAEAFTAACSDVLLVDFLEVRDWTHLWERLRDSPLFAVPYFRLESLTTGVEDGFVDYEQTLETSNA